MQSDDSLQPLIVRWVDRLGWNCQDVCDTIQVLMGRGVAILTVINNMQPRVPSRARSSDCQSWRGARPTAGRREALSPLSGRPCRSLVKRIDPVSLIDTLTLTCVSINDTHYA